MSSIAFALVSIIAFLVTLLMGVYIILQASKLILSRWYSPDSADR